MGRVIWFVAFCVFPQGASAQSLSDLFGGGGGTEPFVAPGRLFSVEVPRQWKVVLTDDPYTFQFTIAGGGDAFLWLRRIEVPAGAHPRQVALNALEQRLKKMPHFKIVGRRNVHIAGHKGAAIVATFAHQGNIQFPRAMEEIYLVVGTEAFIFHFECFEPYANRFAHALNAFYQSFVPRPPAPDAFSSQPEEKFPEVDKVPF